MTIKATSEERRHQVEVKLDSIKVETVSAGALQASEMRIISLKI